MGSDISGFNKMGLEERREKVRVFCNLDGISVDGLDTKTAELMIENVIGVVGLPLGIATNFLINGKDYLVPMALEEPSVIAGASKAAKLTRPSGGFKASSTDPIMIGQMQFVGVKGIEEAEKKIAEKKMELMEAGNKRDSVLVNLGGGLKDIQTRKLKTKRGDMLIVHLLIDVRDAMGANAVNTISEALTGQLEELIGGKSRLRIISNLADKRLAKATCVWKGEDIGTDAVEGVLDAYEFARCDVYRCATHNKGIMNGIDAVIVATGNDFRAVEAGAHAFASLGGYHPLTKYWKDKNGDLVGEIELPLAVGIIGGSIKTNKTAATSIKILGVKTSKELAEIVACVGLANNFAAMYAMVTGGIQKGHMKLHAKNIAVTAGAKGDDVDRVAKKLAEEGNVSVSRAKEILWEKS